MGFNIIMEDNGKDFSAVKPGDVVVLPAFGATLQEMKYLNDLGCQLVDTTCPWVSKVDAPQHLTDQLPSTPRQWGSVTLLPPQLCGNPKPLLFPSRYCCAAPTFHYPLSEANHVSVGIPKDS